MLLLDTTFETFRFRHSGLDVRLSSRRGPGIQVFFPDSGLRGNDTPALLDFQATVRLSRKVRLTAQGRESLYPEGIWR